jgi:serine/threonine protein phosphatase PrpC
VSTEAEGIAAPRAAAFPHPEDQYAGIVGTGRDAPECRPPVNIPHHSRSIPVRTHHHGSPTYQGRAARPFHTADATYGVAQHQGSRAVQADAYTVVRDPVTGRIAAVVADGIGDRDESAWIARVATDYAATVAVRTGDPARAIRAARAHRNLHDLGCPDYDPDRDYWWGEGDTVLAVAVINPGAGEIPVAWTGDCRIYRLGHFGALDQVTTDHTEGERLRRLGILERDAPLCRADSTVTSRLAYGPIGTAAVPVELVRRLLLRSDGIGKQLDVPILAVDLDCADDAVDAAESTVADAAAARSGSDNVTALVLDLAQSPTGRHWPGRRATGPGHVPVTSRVLVE